RPLTAHAKPLRPELIQLQFAPQHQRQPARTPLPWPAQLQLRQLDVDGKQDRYWSVVENTRTARGRVVQRHVLYLGEINDTQG
ncbi:MAG TPA: hypothetical protein VGI28_12165, partial [Stellaceae bacterium]